ncbi:MAG: glycosyltransferase 87 family protein [Solirubrobacteraceae bacterium]
MRRGERAWRHRVGFYGDGLQLLVLGALPILLIALQLVSLVSTHTVATGFSHGPWVADHRLLAGFSPYPGAHSSLLEGITFVYPAVAAIVLAPFSLLPPNAAAQVFTLLCVVALLGTLRVLDVRDWRVYMVALIWPAVMSGWETGNITLLLGLGVALVWRYRDRPAVSGGLIALVISM